MERRTYRSAGPCREAVAILAQPALAILVRVRGRRVVDDQGDLATARRRPSRTVDAIDSPAAHATSGVALPDWTTLRALYGRGHYPKLDLAHHNLHQLSPRNKHTFKFTQNCGKSRH